MNIEVNKVEASIIELGDIFYSKRSKDYLILIKNLENRFYLHGLDGERFVANFYESINRAKECLQLELEEGLYIHYPQSKYKLVMEEV
ncbi:hypothetical protein ACQKNX_07655 [Lysinibacillus sp. NPDC093712]|uniref:hypothetical protein n=1 Tax=Lysinibacillus sp. NPDC093712 TaxID=3390579 RepID=UPI003D03A820